MAAPDRLLLRCALGSFLVFVPYLRVLTDPHNRLEVGYSPALFVEILVMVALAGGVCAGLLRFVQRAAERLPAAVRVPCVRALLAPAAAIVLTAIVSTLCAELRIASSATARLDWLGVVAALLTALLALAAWRAPALWTFLGRAILVAVPLPPILAVTFLSYPDVGIREEEPRLAGQPAAAGDTALGGPVVIVLFDAWDYGLAFGRPDAMSRWRRIAELAATSVFFTGAQSPASYTLNSIPRFLFQTDDPIHFQSNGTWLMGQAGEERPTALYTSLFQSLAGPGTETVVVGSQLNYRILLGDQVDVAFSGRPEWLLGPWDRMRRQLLNASRYTYLPVRSLVGVGDEMAWLHVKSVARVHALALDGLRQGRRNRITFIHYLMPHEPFVYQAAGPRSDTRPRSAPDQEGYLGNLDYLDTVAGQLIDAIRASGLWDATTLVLMSDHGGPFDEPANRGRHVPLIVKLRGQQRPAVVATPVATIDLVDWLLEMRRPPPAAGGGTSDEAQSMGPAPQALRPATR